MAAASGSAATNSSGDASQLAGSSTHVRAERRIGLDGLSYTFEEFQNNMYRCEDPDCRCRDVVYQAAVKSHIERAWAKLELRIADDGFSGTYRQFYYYYGSDAAEAQFLAAAPVRVPLRIADDKRSYTFQQFLDYFGADDAEARWKAATPVQVPLDT